MNHVLLVVGVVGEEVEAFILLEESDGVYGVAFFFIFPVRLIGDPDGFPLFDGLEEQGDELAAFAACLHFGAVADDGDDSFLQESAHCYVVLEVLYHIAVDAGRISHFHQNGEHVAVIVGERADGSKLLFGFLEIFAFEFEPQGAVSVFLFLFFQVNAHGQDSDELACLGFTYAQSVLKLFSAYPSVGVLDEVIHGFLEQSFGYSYFVVVIHVFSFGLSLAFFFAFGSKIKHFRSPGVNAYRICLRNIGENL